MQGIARPKQDEPVIDDSSAFVFPPSIDPVMRERTWADGRLSIGTICGKAKNCSPTHRFPGEIIFSEKFIQSLPILDWIAIVYWKPGNYTVGETRFFEFQRFEGVHVIVCKSQENATRMRCKSYFGIDIRLGVRRGICDSVHTLYISIENLPGTTTDAQPRAIGTPRRLRTPQSDRGGSVDTAKR
jgi:hypothetical protein